MLCYLRPSPRLFLRPIQRCAYSSAPSPIKTKDYKAAHAGFIRVLTLDRPEARNAISKAMLAALKSEVQRASRESESGVVRALIIASADDGSFCAGADLKERATFTQKDTADFLTDLRGTLTMIQDLPIPTISAVAGPAFGGGLELALSTHMRVFGSNTVVGLPETRLAIIPGAGGTYRLPALIGLARARDMILTGRRVAGPEAYFLGLCDRLVEITKEDVDKREAASNVINQALTLAREICEGGPIAVKAALIAVQGCAMGEKAENAAYELVVKTKDRDEALAAFREKRKPSFKGR